MSEVHITPEMIQAGVEALTETRERVGDYWLVIAIYAAMEAVKQFEAMPEGETIH